MAKIIFVISLCCIVSFAGQPIRSQLNKSFSKKDTTGCVVIVRGVPIGWAESRLSGSCYPQGGIMCIDRYDVKAHAFYVRYFSDSLTVIGCENGDIFSISDTLFWQLKQYETEYSKAVEIQNKIGR